MRLDISGTLVGGLLAAEKSAPPGTAPASMNATNADGYHLPLTLSLEIDESEEERDRVLGQGSVGPLQLCPSSGNSPSCFHLPSSLPSAAAHAAL